MAPLTQKVLGLVILMVAGIGSYLAITFVTGAINPRELKAFLRRKKA